MKKIFKFSKHNLAILFLVVFCVVTFLSSNFVQIVNADNVTNMSSEKNITSFSFEELNPVVQGVIDHNMITLSVPTGTDITKLTPTITVSDKAAVDPLSRTTADFTNPVVYKVTAEDGSEQNFTAIVFVKNFIPLNSANSNTNNTSNNSSNNSSSTPATSGYATAKDIDTPNGGLVPCGIEKSPIVKDANGKESGGEILHPCGFNDLLKTINILVNFVLFKLAVPVAAIMFAYAGFLLVTSGGSSEQKTKAKSIFLNVALGIVFAAAAWLVIHTISSILGYDGSWIGF